MTDPSPIWEPSADEVLKRRAEQFAKLPLAPDTGDEVEVLVCRLGTERYAVETRHLRAVQWARGITPVPSTPAFVVGIVSVRGEIVTLLDLAAMIGLASALRSGDLGVCPVLLLGLPGLRSGLVVEEVLGVERFKLNSLQPSLSGREFARGVGPSNTVLLDLEQLLSSGRFTVADEP
jgi:purine-binding chemotaxis protein CheW